MEFERVFYKNDFASGTALLSLYMIVSSPPPSSFMWANCDRRWYKLGKPWIPWCIYIVDYGSAITENRELYREKYSELKLEGNFLKVSPAYLMASVGDSVHGIYTNNDAVFTTPLWGDESATNFYIVRHADYQQEAAASYQFTVTTSKGALTIPQLGGSLTLSGRDSKWHVTDYDLGGTTLLYSTAEIFTWKDFGQKTTLVVYGGP